MTVLITVDNDLVATQRDVSQTGSFQRSQGGRDLLPTGSVPFATTPAQMSLTLIGGRTVSYADIYKSQPWVAAAVNKRYRPISRLPLKVYRTNSQGDKERVRDHRLVDLIQRPWKQGSPTGLKQCMFAPMYVHGNSLLAKDRRPGSPPSGFRPLDWRQLMPIIREGQLAAWQTSQYGAREFLEPVDVLHLQWWSPDGLGISPLQQLGITVRIERAAQGYQESYLGRGARPPSGLFLNDTVTQNKELRAELRDDLDRLYGGPDNAGRPVIVPGGADWKQIGHTAVEAELVEQRRLAREEIAAVYDMPPTLIGNLDKATYSNIETQGGWLYTDVLGPDLVLGEQEFKAQVIDGEPAFEGLFVEYDLAGVLRGDKLKEIEALREAIGSMLLKPQEGRQVLNLPVYGDPGDDANPANQLWAPVNNLQPIDLAGQPAPPPDRSASRALALAEALLAGNGHH